MKTLAALAIVVAGAVAAFAVYAFGWRDGSSPPVPGSRVVSLEQGDVVRMPSANVECEASQEGGFPRLFCMRTARSRYQVEFYSDAVRVFDLADPEGEPMAATYSLPAER